MADPLAVVLTLDLTYKLQIRGTVGNAIKEPSLLKA